MVTDTIGDFLTRIKNAQQRKRKEVVVPSSKIVKAIAQILKEEGFIDDFAEEGINGNVQNQLRIKLRYVNRKCVIRNIRRVSKPGVRIYLGYRDIPNVVSGTGIAILTTSKGVMTGENARKMKVGGEYLCEIW